jgi:hypothetical protein
MTVNTRIFYIIIFSSFIFLGCNNPFAPRLAGKDTPTSKLLTEQKTPSEVLSNFEYAYTFKDSLIYSDLLDNSFIFRSINYYNDPPEPIHWGRDLELRTTGKMLRYFNTIDLVWNTISNPDTISPPDTSQYFTGYIIEHHITFTLTLDGGKFIQPINGEVLFRFTQHNDKYYISYWEDLII